MSRFAFVIAAAALLAGPAGAANPVHASATAKSVEKGVTVWRGPIMKAAAAPILAGQPNAAPCRLTIVLTDRTGWAPRRLATHGFWSGRPFGAPYGVATAGFFADRMAAGL